MALIDDKLIKSTIEIDHNTSDGYHTFKELYLHRNLLFINLCLAKTLPCYFVREHYEGYFLLVLETNYGQVSYHCSNDLLSLVEGKITESFEHEFDGHSADTSVCRLYAQAMRLNEK